MIDDKTTRAGRLSFLSEEDKSRIYEAALHILAEIGMRVNHDEGRALMLAAGCTQDGNGCVHVPRELVARARATAPARIAMYDRAGELAFTLGGYMAVFGTGSDLMHLFDLESGERRETSLADVARSARLCDALDHIDFVMSGAYPNEVDPHRAYLESFRAMMVSTTKPLVMTAEDGADVERMWRRPALCAAAPRSCAPSRTSSCTVSPAARSSTRSTASTSCSCAPTWASRRSTRRRRWPAARRRSPSPATSPRASPSRCSAS